MGLTACKTLQYITIKTRKNIFTWLALQQHMSFLTYSTIFLWTLNAFIFMLCVTPLFGSPVNQPETDTGNRTVR